MSGLTINQPNLTAIEEKKIKAKNKKTHRELISEITDVNYKKYEPFLRLTSHQRKIAKRKNNSQLTL